MDKTAARRQMVRQQVRTAEVFDERILAVLDHLPRHEFVPPRYADLAYADTEIPLGHDRFMLTPIVEGRLLEALDPGHDERVLEIGTGCGYLTACLASLAASVVSIDTVAAFSAMAGEALDRAEIRNAELRTLDALLPPAGESFDAIAVTGSLDRIDERLIDALNPGGRLFAVVGAPPVMEARLLTRSVDNGITDVAVFETCLPRLTGDSEVGGFSF